MLRFISLLVPCIMCFLQPLAAQSLIVDTTKIRHESKWKGFDRVDFEIANRQARLIKPFDPLPGNPWIWRARFPDWHTEADSILVAEGFHLAYVNTNNLFGSPSALKIWDEFYQWLIIQYDLQAKVALMGVSRGGLFIYNWAKNHPDKVSCIYAEAPVCDFKSWPGGFGTSKGNKSSWKALKSAYGFKSDLEARQYGNNPIDGLKSLAEAKVPVLHMIGLQDHIVPPEENTYLLVNKYIRMGGVAGIVPCTSYPQEMEGHHFPIETPRLVADFVKYHSVENNKLQSSKFHNYRGSLKNAKEKFEREGFGRVAFLGGSITFNPGWRDSICNYLQKKFPSTTFDFVAAGISSMGTTPAAFRLDRDVLSKGKIDLLFEEAAVNDATNGRTSIEQIRGMEGIIRNLKKANPMIDIVMMHFVDPEKMNDYRNGITPEVIVNHNKVASHYNVSTIDLAKEVTDRIDHGEFTWEDDFKDLHPSPFGQVVYAKSIISFLERSFEQAGEKAAIQKNNLPYPLDQFNYESGYLIKNTSTKASKGWHLETNWIPSDNTRTRPNYVNVPMLISEQPGSRLKIDFDGRAIGIAVAAGKDAGIIEYSVDKKDWKRINLFTTWSANVHLPWYFTLESELSKGKHRLEIRIIDEKDERSTGNACRIRYFFANR